MYNQSIIFVGDRPSRDNTDLDVAFVGTESGERLFKWIEYLDIYTYQALNVYTIDSKVDTKNCMYLRKHNGATIVALGNNASNVLKKLEIKHFKLPHPSGRNRKLNDKNYVASELQKCREWLNERIGNNS